MMTSSSVRVGAWALAREEIRALPRNLFAMGAVAALLIVLVPVAAFGLEGEGAIVDMLVFLWLVAMLIVAVVVAARVASVRSSRFVDSLFTTPLEQATWLAAQALVGAFLVLLVLLAQLPFVLVHVALVGAPAGLAAVAVAAIAVGAVAVALGLFCGVVVGEAGPGAAAGLAGGFGFLAFVLLLVHAAALSLSPTPTREVLLHVAALSPLALAIDAAGVELLAAQSEEPWRPALGLVALVAGLGGAAWLAYTRAQGPLGWEPRGGRQVVAALVALAVLVPVVSAGGAYRDAEQSAGFAYSHGELTRIGFVEPGAPVTDEAFTVRAFFEMEEMTLGEDLELDVLVMLLTPQSARVRDVRIAIEGSERVQVVDGGRAHVRDGVPVSHARPTEGFAEGPAEDAPLRPVYRVPVTLRPLEVEAPLGSFAPISVATSFTADGRTQESLAKITLEANLRGASAILALAGAPLPLAAIGAILARRIRTR